MRQVWIFVCHVGIRVVSNHVLVVPKPRARVVRKQIRQPSIDTPVCAKAKVQSIMPLNSFDDACQCRGEVRVVYNRDRHTEDLT